MTNLYLLSGLGADERLFGNFHPANVTLHHVHWIEPESGESIHHYAGRLAAQIHEPNPILLGVSFGGMMAIEISRHIEVRKIILVSSACTRKALPKLYRISGALGLPRIIPKPLLSLRLDTMLGIQTDEERLLSDAMVKSCSARFLRWGMNEIATWKNQTCPNNVVSIHGNADRMLPLHHADYLIDKGGHFMIYNRGKEIAEIVEKSILALGG